MLCYILHTQKNNDDSKFHDNNHWRDHFKVAPYEWPFSNTYLNVVLITLIIQFMSTKNYLAGSGMIFILKDCAHPRHAV